MVTHLNFLKDDEFNNLVYSIYLNCELCNKPKFGCCIQPICSNQRQFICYDCQIKYNNSIHFLHEVIDLKSFCLNVDISKQSKTITQFYDGVIANIMRYKNRMQSKIVSLKNSIRQYQQNVQSSLNIITLLKQHINKHNEKELRNKRTYLSLKDSILRKQTNQQRLRGKMDKIKQYLQGLKRDIQINLNEQFKLADKVEIFMSFTYQQSLSTSQITNFIDYLKSLYSKHNSFYDEQIIKRQKTQKKILRHSQPLSINCLELKLINIRMISFKLFPKTIKRLYLVDMKPTQYQLKDILHNGVRQLHFLNNHMIPISYFKMLYKLCLEQKLRILTIQNVNAIKFTKNHEILLKIKIMQTKKIHLSRLSRIKKLIRQQVLEILIK